MHCTIECRCLSMCLLCLRSLARANAKAKGKLRQAICSLQASHNGGLWTGRYAQCSLMCQCSSVYCIACGSKRRLERMLQCNGCTASVTMSSNGRTEHRACTFRRSNATRLHRAKLARVCQTDRPSAGRNVFSDAHLAAMSHRLPLCAPTYWRHRVLTTLWLTFVFLPSLPCSSSPLYSYAPTSSFFRLGLHGAVVLASH